MRRAFLLFLCLSACGEPVRGGNSGGGNEDAPDVVTPEPVPVRIGELGPNFDACNADGRVVRVPVESGGGIAVKAAPFDAARETARLPLGAVFFVCTRSHDERWYGIVFDEKGRASASCGVSAPVRERRDYAGPCRSGWVQSAFVKLAADAPEDTE